MANWLIGPLAAAAGSNNIEISEINIPAQNFLELIDLVEKKQAISNLTGKAVLEEMLDETHYSEEKLAAADAKADDETNRIISAVANKIHPFWKLG